MQKAVAASTISTTRGAAQQSSAFRTTSLISKKSSRAPSSSASPASTRAGRTPNPCVSCNNFVKLGTLVQYADRLNARYVATGHYARIERGEDGVHLYRNPHAKDQAYALAQLAPEQLDRLLLPLGELDKAAHARGSAPSRTSRAR